MTAIVPIPKIDLAFRLATENDIAALDAMQKKYNRGLGFFRTGYFKGYIDMGAVLIAQCDSRIAGYCIWRDRYKHRDELGVIYQLCVAGDEQRKLVGAALVREAFDRAAYGCKLFSAWCAQDIEANRFWESMGFVPLAFRAGGQSKKRTHIFWQTRIREGDTTTPWWFPHETGGGAIREDRLVFPIPPGKHWSDEMPRILPGHDATPKLEAPIETRARAPKSKSRKKQPENGAFNIARSRFSFVAPKVAKEKPTREKKPKQKNDPKLVHAARELRDRYLEHVNTNPEALEAPSGKYHVSRQIQATPVKDTPLLAA